MHFGEGPPLIDGVPLDWGPCDPSPVPLERGSECFIEETPEGVRYAIWTTTPPGGREAQAVVVPPGHVLAVGDHRDRSHDSRHFGTIPRDAIIGRAIWRWMPFGREGSLIPVGAR
ncbi:MAG: signal peptidase I [Myxococcota bacterium]